MARLGSERHVVQSPLVRYAEEAGWTYLTPEEAIGQRQTESNPILIHAFRKQVQRLNPGYVNETAADEVLGQLRRVRPSIEGNLEAWEYLRGLRNVFVAAENRERPLHLIDFADASANTFHVTDEFRFDNGSHRIRPDVVFFINGIPIITVETKAATKLDGIAESLEQTRRYHREAPEFLALLQLYTLTHLVQFYYGATWNLERKGVFNWRDELAGQDFETLVKTFVAPPRVLRILSDFILFTRRDEELSKVVLRPHQMRAVDRALFRARDSGKRRGLIWHTQGSGKTFTMITIAQKLIEEPAFDNPTVLMLVDRNELESQLFTNLRAVGIEHAAIAESKLALQQLLRGGHRGLIVSMIHKFDDIPANLNVRDNVFVLVDEAHRSTGGDLGNYLMGALPNATYLGFTGTPVDRTAYGKGTFKVFGVDDPETGYLDKYSIKESIEDGTTVPLYYTLAPNDLRPSREVLEREFLDLADAEGLSDIEDLNRVLEKAVTLRNMLKNRDRVQRVAQYVANDFSERVSPMGYKAFLVGVDREACALYKEALDQYLPPDASAVVISSGHNDPPELARHHLSEDEEQRVRKAFLKNDTDPRILIVTEKLLTGFDAPLLYCMYLDKPMRDHVLLQAIARVNRPYEDENGKAKPGGFVLDFVGIFENLEKALAFDSRDVQSVVQGLDTLQARFAELIEQARSTYLPLSGGLARDKAAEAVLEFFREEESRHEFYRFYLELEDLYEIISPDAFLRPYIDGYERVADMYKLLRSMYEAGDPDLRALARKTATLVQQHTQAGVISEALAVYEITPQTLDQIALSNQPNTINVFNLLKSIQQEVAAKAALAPYLISIGARAEEIAAAFKDRQATTEQALRALEALVQEINEARLEQSDRNVSTEAFAVLWLLKRRGVAQAPEVADAMDAAFREHPHWRASEAEGREVRKALYTVLDDLNLKDVPAVAEEILGVLRREP